MGSSSNTNLELPDYISDVIAEFMKAQLSCVSQALIPRTSRSPVVLCVIKDEMDRLPDFLNHYRSANIERFVFIDNNSSDETALYLSRQPDVDLYQIASPFIWTRKQGWINLAIALTGRSPNSWYIYVDSDEHIVYDGYPHRTFEDLVRWAESLGLRRVRGMLVDMYAEGPLLCSKYFSGQSLSETYPLFDSDGYVETRTKEIISRKGGPRVRAFGTANADFRPEMTKYPLFKLDYNELFVNPHHIWPYDANFYSDCYLGVLHYKFLPNLISKMEKAISELSYWSNSIEYKCYQNILSSNPDLSLLYSGSLRYQGPHSLISARYIREISWKL